MKKRTYKILIADRNPRVRKFLKREMEAAGYEVQLAETGHEVISTVFGDESLDLLILDTDLPDTEREALLNKLENRLPHLPVVLHTLSDVFPLEDRLLSVVAIIEKSGSSVERLKETAFEILNTEEREK